MNKNYTLTDKHRGRLIRYFRKLRGMTQTDLALRLGVSVTTVYDWEKGARPSVKHWYSLCQELQIPPELQKAGLSDSFSSKKIQMEFVKQLHLSPEVQQILEDAIDLYYEEDEPLKK